MVAECLGQHSERLHSDKHAQNLPWLLVAPKPVCQVYSKSLVSPSCETLLLLYIKPHLLTFT